MPVIEVDNLYKRYGDQVAVDDLSFTIEKGEIFGILGPNGAGKTTTVEIIEGLRTPDRGTVRVLGLDPSATAKSCGGRHRPHGQTLVGDVRGGAQLRHHRRAKAAARRARDDPVPGRPGSACQRRQARRGDQGRPDPLLHGRRGAPRRPRRRRRLHPRPGRPQRPRRDGQGFGLDAMRQRLWRVAGRLEIETAPGEGTAVNARVPALAAEAGE